MTRRERYAAAIGADFVMLGVSGAGGHWVFAAAAAAALSLAVALYLTEPRI